MKNLLITYHYSNNHHHGSADIKILLGSLIVMNIILAVIVIYTIIKWYRQPIDVVLKRKRYSLMRMLFDSDFIMLQAYTGVVLILDAIALIAWLGWLISLII